MSGPNFGILNNFDHVSQSWKTYKSKLNQYFIANDLDGAKDAAGKKRKAILLSALSEGTFKLAADLALPKQLEDVPFEDILNLLDRHFTPTRIGFGERHNFYSASQQPGESHTQWAARLRGLTAHCGFANIEEALRDRFVMGMIPGQEKEKLYAQNLQDLTLAKAVQLAENIRCARAGAAASNAEPRSSADQLYKITKGSKENEGHSKVPCAVCGYTNHKSSECRFSNLVCKKCKVKGHLRRMCTKVKYVNLGTGSEGDDDGKLYNIRSVRGEPMVETVTIHGVDFKFEIDSGSAVTVISQNTYNIHFSDVSLQPTDKRLHSYTGESIKCIGMIPLPVTFAGKTQSLNAYVVCDNGPALLGRDFTSLFNLQLSPVLYCNEIVIKKLYEEYPHLFSDKLGCYNKTKVKLTLKENSKPIFIKARPIAFALRDKIDKELDRLVNLGILVPVEHSDYASPIVPVLKRNGTIRLCADYSVSINKQLVIEQYPLPTANELFSKLYGGQKFTKLDLSMAYNQFMLSEDSQDITCINTHRGLYKYTRLVFGLTSGPAVFQRAMEGLLAGMDGVLCLLDDVLITGGDEKQHLNRLHAVLKRLESAGLTLQKVKCVFFQDEVSYLGYVISKDGLKKSSDKVEAMVNAPAPKNINELQSFLGLVNYYRNFVPGASIVLRPLYDLLKKNIKWHWSSEQENAFNTVKQILASEQVLAHFNTNAKVILTVDASPTGLSAILSQIEPDGSERPVSFASRSLNAAEKRYSQIQKEATAIVFGVRRFHQYLYGRSSPFVLRTDHKPLTSIFHPERGIPEVSANRLQSSSASELITRRGVFSRRQYGSVEQVSNLPGPSDGPDVVIRRYRLENGNSLGEKDELFGPHNTPVLENPEFQTRWYFKYFLGKMHQIYVGLDYTREPFLLSVVQESAAGLLRSILFTKNGAQKIYIPPSAWNVDPKTDVRSRPTVKQILAQFPAMERVDKTPREILCADVQKDVLLLEEQEGSVNFKIGVMFMRPGQQTDDQMLSNEFGDAAFNRFVALLGDRIRLKGWNRFRGGLDVKGDMTGLYSVYTMHHGHEIMFHISTMLPHSKENKQQLERKRHIGNDIVNIIFVDEQAHDTFNPQYIKSHFTHIFAIVSEVFEGYKLSIFSDDCVPPFGPSLPCPPIFLDSNLFRDYLLVKMMNGEKSAFQTPIFTQKRQRTLDTLIRDIYTEHCTDHKVPMLSRRALSDVWSGNSQSAGAARTERFLHIGQAIKLDAVLRGDAPTSLLSSGEPQRGRRAPWEGRLWRSTPLPGSPVCAEQISEGKLLVSTNSNTYVLEESGTTRVVLRWEGSVRAARLTGRAGLFRVGARANGVGSLSSNAGSAGVYAVPLAELYAGAWAMRPLQDCKQARLSRTKTAHFFDLVEHNGRITLAVAVGRRVLIMAEEERLDNGKGFDYVHIKDIMLGEVPSLIKYMDCDSGVIVAAYKHHWEVVDCANGQCVKRADNTESRRGTLVNALRIGDERDRQLVLCYNHTCHFERLTNRGLESDAEYDFHWTTVPLAVVNAFPYIMAFAEDLLEIRLVANGSLVHAACIPGLKLLCGRRDIFFVACAPEYVPLSDDDEASLGLPPESLEQIRQRRRPYSVDEDERGESTGEPSSSGTTRTLDAAYASASSRSSSMSSEYDSIRPPLQRMAPISPPSSPKVTASTSSDHPHPPSSARCVRVFKIPQGNLGAGYARQSVSANQPQVAGGGAVVQEPQLQQPMPQHVQLQQALLEQIQLQNLQPQPLQPPPDLEPRPSTSRN